MVAKRKFVKQLKFIFIFISISIAPCFAQFKQGIFERLSTEQGISLSSINCIFQDSKGFIWIGSFAGLFRYDGYETVAYYRDPNDPLSIGDNRINSIAEDQAGNLWISTQVGLNYFDRKAERFTRFFKENSNLNSNIVETVLEDETGQVWILTDKGLQWYHPITKSFLSYEGNPSETPELKESAIYEVFKDQSGKIWAGTDKGLKLFDKKKQVFSTVLLKYEKGGSSIQVPVVNIGQDEWGNLWLGSDNGLIRYDPYKQIAKRFLFAAEGAPGNYCINVLVTRNKWIWISTGNDLIRFDPYSQSFDRMKHDPHDPLSISHSLVMSMMEDSYGIVWLGTLKGVNKYDPAGERFKKYISKSAEFIRDVLAMRSFYEIAPGALLLQEKNGLEVLDLQKGTTSPFPYKPTVDLADWNTGMTCFLRDINNKLWIGTANGGVFLFDKVKKTFDHFKHNPDNPLSLGDKNIREIFQDSKGAIWLIHMYGGVSRFNEITKTFDRFLTNCEDRNCNARTIYEDRSKNIWVGTRGGLNKFDRNTNTFIRYFHDPDNPKSISENTVFDIYEDKNENLWLGTYGGGLNKMNRNTGTFTYYTIKDGLPDNNIFSVQPDKNGNLWLSTYAGIVRFNPETEEFRTFDYRDGLLNKGYDAFSYYQSPYDGSLIYEGSQGLDIFQPDIIKIDSTLPAVVITDLLLFNKSVPISKDHIEAQKGQYYLSQSITETKEMKLPYKMKVITFKFAALHFANPQKNQYAYQLEKFDKDWQYVGSSRTATYTNLKPGDYTFLVKASNADGVWNEKGVAIKLTILPPWWQTWWAYLLYFLALSSLVWVVYNYQRRRWQLQAQLQLEQREAIRLKELDTFKSNLYANITHEFRTPLTVILGNVEEINNKLTQTASHSVLNLLKIIKRNGENLLRLINQVLDLSKLESGVMYLHWQQGDIITYIRYLHESFESLARSKQIDLNFHTQIDELIMDYDPDKILKIISNLLSNAIKFTPEGGKVDVRISRDAQHLLVQVEDSGIGIAPEKLPYIFDRFYQTDTSSTRKAEGAGIGLALTKELISLLQGSIEVQSTMGKSTTFIVQLPITNQAPFEVEQAIKPLITSNAQPTYNLPSSQSDKTERPLLMIVEDNADVAQYIASCVVDKYKILFAKNGKEGIAQGLEVIPDIIISDVMMPEADGFELCETLKSDERTSHIPIILLTAKATVEDRITGLRRGADEYLAKPFNREELQVRLQKLIELRKKLQQRYSQLPINLPPTTDPVLQQEDAFILRVRKLIEVHLSDENFDVELLSHFLHLHRSQVYRKIKALTDKDPSQLIHSIRLLKAEELLLHSEKNMTEIALELGFSDSSHFSRTFKEAKGTSPLSFRKKHRRV